MPVAGRGGGAHDSQARHGIQGVSAGRRAEGPRPQTSPVGEAGGALTGLGLRVWPAVTTPARPPHLYPQRQHSGQL